MDQVRRKYGSHSIGFASVINNDLGIEFKGDGDGPQEKRYMRRQSRFAPCLALHYFTYKYLKTAGLAGGLSSLKIQKKS